MMLNYTLFKNIAMLTYNSPLRFGTMQAKIGLIKLLRNFKILPCEKTLIPMKYSPSSGFQAPLGGMWLKMQSID